MNDTTAPPPAAPGGLPVRRPSPGGKGGKQAGAPHAPAAAHAVHAVPGAVRRALPAAQAGRVRGPAHRASRRLPADELKVALGLHTRSNRYIEAVASGLPRHDLNAQPVEPVAPEHVHHAILELYRRKSTTPQEPAARQRAVAQLAEAIERSGLGRDGYNERFGAAPAGRELLDEALAAIGQKAAKQEALRRAFTASGKSVEEFADMYGMPVADVKRLVQPA
jgi:ProP effector